MIELVGGGSVINGAYPVYFFLNKNYEHANTGGGRGRGINAHTLSGDFVNALAPHTLSTYTLGHPKRLFLLENYDIKTTTKQIIPLPPLQVWGWLYEHRFNASFYAFPTT